MNPFYPSEQEDKHSDYFGYYVLFIYIASFSTK